MALSIESLQGEVKTSPQPGSDDPKGEIRADSEGKLYVYILKDEEKKVKKVAKEKVDFDLNGDGKVDKEDVSLMAKGLRKFGKKKGKK